MSVDWLDPADIWSLCSLHDVEGSQRTPPRRFHGWYVVSGDAVRSVGWTAVPIPTPPNPWHAEIRLPVYMMEQEDHLLQDCIKIASKASWRARP